VYDSVYTTVSAETIANICATMPGGQREITVKLINAQRQRGNTDCDVFACAYMERLARSQSVVDVTFDVPKLRCHLVVFAYTGSNAFPYSDSQKWCPQGRCAADGCLCGVLMYGSVEWGSCCRMQRV